MSQAAPLFDHPSNRQQNIDMQVTLLKSKLLRAEVTDRALHYEGSLAIDSALMEQIGLVPYEKILVANIANGERLETYAIEAPKGSHTISLNGAAAHKGKLGDLLVIMSFAQFEQAEAKSWKPKVLVLADGNKRVVRADNVLVGEDVFV
jgi:aspartate 1-decarboxylase